MVFGSILYKVKNLVAFNTNKIRALCLYFVCTLKIHAKSKTPPIAAIEADVVANGIF